MNICPIFCRSDHPSRIREHEDTKLTNKNPRWTESVEIRGACTDLENHKDATGMCGKAGVVLRNNVNLREFSDDLTPSTGKHLPLYTRVSELHSGLEQIRSH